ncbi:Uncharacterised protein [Vibrio cholerae]|nr:Uncharacterised protein [Vibrio cholerae]
MAEITHRTCCNQVLALRRTRKWLILLAQIQVAFPTYWLLGIHILEACAKLDVFRFITAKVPGCQRHTRRLMHCRNLRDHFIYKAFGRVQTWIDKAHAIIELHCGDVRGILRIQQTELIGRRLIALLH